MPEEPLARLQALLRELFQYDYADLDFGIYRLLRLKRREVEAFLTEQLPRRVDEVFKGAAGEVHAQLERELAELADRVRQEIDAEALVPTGEIRPDYRQQKAKAARELIAAYEAKRKQVQEIQVSEEHKAEVFNHLWAFFSRYYEAGDFIPKRRYGARETYAVPYNGEEVIFHWANRDQHYVKTAEALRDYAFTVAMLGKPCRVRFTLIEASLPPGNTKGDTRYFFPLLKGAAWDKDTRTFTLPFHYRLPTETEIEKHGKNSKLQESVLQAALPKIIQAAPDAGLKARLAEIVEQKENEEISLLLKRLRHFCRKNTSDYFIHKNLDGFLRRELEYYLKDQVLHLADLDGDLPAKQRTLRVVRQLAEEVIQFLAQIENIQKRLFEKRKFVLKTDYLVPIQNVPRELWKEVLGNERQLAAWKELFAVERRKVNEKFLAEHPTLVVNTTHFDTVFKARLLAGFNDLDEATDGLLVHSENYQALRFLERKYAGKVKCFYIDPPYNTGGDGFIYKDRYLHSTWLAMMHERLMLAKDCMADNGVVFCSIDGIELAHLRLLFESIFGVRNQVGALVWKNATDNNPTRIAVEHEHVLCFAKDTYSLKPEWKSRYSDAKDLLLNRYEELKRAGLSLDEMEKEYRQFIKDNAATIGELERYKFLDDDGPYTGSESVHNPHPGGYDYEIPHSESGKPMRKPANGYRFPWETMKRDFIDKDRLIYGPDEKRIVKIKLHLRDYVDSLRSVIILDGRLAAYTIGELFEGSPEEVFKNAKPVELLERLVSFTSQDGDWIMDFVAGSGTTGHAVMTVNSQEATRRRFLLVDMAAEFVSVALPRTEKVMFAPEWKDGKPVRMATKEEAELTPRLVKVLRLEGYEDALHNLVSDDTLDHELPRAKAFKEKVGGDAYRLTYMARLPLEASASMLNLAKLEHPFAYTIEVIGEDGPRTETVDLVETFDFLYGLHVERIELWRDDAGKRDYRAVKAKKADGRRVLVLWRDMEKLDPAVERKFLEARLKQDGPFDDAWINGDCAVPGVQSLDGLFKRLLEEEER